MYTLGHHNNVYPGYTSYNEYTVFIKKVTANSTLGHPNCVCRWGSKVIMNTVNI